VDHHLLEFLEKRFERLAGAGQRLLLELTQRRAVQGRIHGTIRHCGKVTRGETIEQHAGPFVLLRGKEKCVHCRKTA